MPERRQVIFSSRIYSLMDDVDLTSSLDFLASLQQSSGMIPWFEGGRADPWNHTEAMIALALGGRVEEALAGLRWLSRMQNADGTWCHFYMTQGVAEPRRDTNTCCYPVVLVSVLDRIVSSKADIEPYVDMVLTAIDRVVEHQRADGSIPWAVDPRGEGYPTSLVAASSSICDSLAIAAELSERHGRGGGGRYLDSRELLSQSVADLAGPYADTSGWAMDHYYPRMGGIADSESLSRAFLDRFYLPDWGVRCISPNDWFTAAETAETAMALHLEGEEVLSQEVYLTLDRFRGANGGYLTGVVRPTGVSFPHLEQSSYSVAAVLISSYVLTGKARGSIGATILGLFS